jgi:hypothetical protein
MWKRKAVSILTNSLYISLLHLSIPDIDCCVTTDLSMKFSGYFLIFYCYDLVFVFILVRNIESIRYCFDMGCQEMTFSSLREVRSFKP